MQPCAHPGPAMESGRLEAERDRSAERIRWSGEVRGTSKGAVLARVSPADARCRSSDACNSGPFPRASVVEKKEDRRARNLRFWAMARRYFPFSTAVAWSSLSL
jgi:hypothetical protein